MQTTVPFLDLSREYEVIGEQLEVAASEVLRSGWYVLGPQVTAFENEFAAYCGAKHAIGVGCGLDAIELLLEAYDIGAGDEVIVPANTYIATWLGVSNIGATPVPVEPDRYTRNIDPALIEAAITDATRAIFIVHLYGSPAPMTEINAIAKRHNLLVFEDAAQAHGAEHGGRRAGALCDGAAFSFYPTKNLGAVGDGGAVTTDDEAIADKIRLLRNYGSPKKYVNDLQGRNSRLDELQAGLLRVKLRHLDAWNERREYVASVYNEGLAGIDGLQLPLPEPEGSKSANHIYAVQVESRRDEVMEQLAALGVGTLIHYPHPPHRSKAYSGFAECSFPITDWLAQTEISLPMSPFLSDDELAHVVEQVRSALR